jgi:DNA-binding CsgD family transcriptional regulator
VVLPPVWQDSGRLGELSAREREIAALVALGLTNRQIADRLTVSPNTVGTHVRNILHKLDVQRRSQIAVAFAQTAPSENGAEPASVEGPRPTTLDRRWLLAGVAALVLVAALAVTVVRTEQAQAAVLFHMEPAHAASAFQTLARIDAATWTEYVPPAGHALSSVPAGLGNTVDYLDDGVQVSSVKGLTLLWQPQLAVSDVEIDVRARYIAGDAGYLVQMRGCPSEDAEFYNVHVVPPSGAVSIVRTRCRSGDAVAELVPEGELHLAPIRAGDEQQIQVRMRGRHISVSSRGAVVAQADDPGPPLPRGGVRFGVLPPGVIRFRSFDVRQLS